MSGKTILYVEDNEFNRKIVRQLLAKTTYRLREALDGEEGVASALATPPDLILMDIQLPRMSGLDATRQLRNDPRTAAVPIIVVTSFALSGDEPKATAAGATAYLAKPYSPRALLAKIREIVPEGGADALGGVGGVEEDQRGALSSTVTRASSAPTLTSRLEVPSVSCQICSTYLPGGTLDSTNSPASLLSA